MLRNSSGKARNEGKSLKILIGRVPNRHFQSLDLELNWKVFPFGGPVGGVTILVAGITVEGVVIVSGEEEIASEVIGVFQETKWKTFNCCAWKLLKVDGV